MWFLHTSLHLTYPYWSRDTISFVFSTCCVFISILSDDASIVFLKIQIFNTFAAFPVPLKCNSVTNLLLSWYCTQNIIPIQSWHPKKIGIFLLRRNRVQRLKCGKIKQNSSITNFSFSFSFLIKRLSFFYFKLFIFPFKMCYFEIKKIFIFYFKIFILNSEIVYFRIKKIFILNFRFFLFFIFHFSF